MLLEPTEYLRGVLHKYIEDRVVFEVTQTSAHQQHKPHVLLFIGGLNDGLFTVPYVKPLANALKPSPWSLFWVELSSAHCGWGTSSLNKDIEQIAQSIQFIQKLQASRNPPGNKSKVVVMGHSTGCQDVLHYLHSPNPLGPQPGGLEDGLLHLIRPVVDGAIMQAPISDREELRMNLDRSPDPVDAWATYRELVSLAKSQASTDLLPLHMTIKMKYRSDTALSSYRFLSLASPESPLVPSDDDKFSSDLPYQVLTETFGRITRNGLLRDKLLVLYSQSDETVPDWVNKVELLERWKEATNAEGVKWADESGLIPGAGHKVQDEGQNWLITRVCFYLNRLEKT
ncbi:uncharacterized protein BDW43DRAFT_313451 [Aspergillus alliaceus]|uniref:uncharacterized protein n=1 Tax=Petromyces alliaceus TaxID=209559 RepID=UPI0012A7381F|nr:uncharacterized protein BDW43DRAFT_313451 [Aspergillus alliaceus]KAB8231126.1 hypothetical protein BDW43DRAFT_313451 [Aspergillus alliaceus]